jgi:hypothetical protein
MQDTIKILLGARARHDGIRHAMMMDVECSQASKVISGHFIFGPLVMCVLYPKLHPLGIALGTCEHFSASMVRCILGAREAEDLCDREKRARSEKEAETATCNKRLELYYPS